MDIPALEFVTNFAQQYLSTGEPMLDLMLYATAGTITSGATYVMAALARTRESMAEPMIKLAGVSALLVETAAFGAIYLEKIVS